MQDSKIRQSKIYEAQENLAASLVRLDDCLSTLRGVLSPVCVPAANQAVRAPGSNLIPDAQSEPVESKSDFCLLLESRILHVNALVASVHHIIDSLEI